MSITVKSLTYRGDVKAAVGVGGLLCFVTVHSEGHATGVYRLDADKITLNLDPLPQGAVALVADGATLWVAGTDNRIYRASTQGGAPVAVGPQLPAAPVALALLSDARLAVLAGNAVLILSRKDGKLLQSLEIPEPGSSLAADPTGQWFVAGTTQGTLCVFECEDKPEFVPSATAHLHQGVVTALLFEQEELRFLSAGADQKLLSTHARGKLEPEDKGRSNNHSDLVTALLWGPADRFFSGSRDRSVKTWPRTGGVKPATLKEGIGKVVAVALVKIHNRPHLVVASDDNSFRYFLIDEAGKFGEETHRFHDAYAWVTYEFSRDESSRRETALRALAEYNDTRSIELLSEQIGKDADHGLRLLGTQLLGASSHPRAAKLLEQRLTHADEAVRVAALAGLRRHLGENDLRPLDLALKVDKADVGKVAVQAFEQLAARDDQALARLNEAINVRTPEVRQAALASLEKVYPADSPEADLYGLTSKHADVRRLALIRLFQRGMLPHTHVQAALRWRAEDADADVRRTAFLLSLFTRAPLAQTLRTRDPELHRQLVELETFTADGTPPAAAQAQPPQPPAKEKSALGEIASQLGTLIRRAPAGSGESKPALGEGDYDPLLQATASRALDTCLRGARGLAVLGDARAFGLLLQLSREDNAPARVDVCRAMAALDDPRSIKRLRSLLYDADAAVRDAAFSALAFLHHAEPLQAAESGLNSAFEDVRRRGLQLLISEVRKALPTTAEQPGWQLLVRALNDSFLSVRSEAFKASLNLQIGGGGVKTLLFVMQSVHADIRREVLTEAMAQANEPWAWTLLLEFFNDPDPKLREEAFAFATKKSKELQPLEAGLASQHADIRKQAVQGLIKKHTQPAQALLIRALADNDKEIRQLVLDALVSEDARQPLTQALNSPHADVRVQAARALARHGSAAALAPLLALATTPEPEEQERKGDWMNLALAALEGLADLGDSAALAQLVPLLQSKQDKVRQAAARALMWVAVPHHLETLRQALQHDDHVVKYHAALGLAYAGDPLVASLVFSEQAAKVLSAQERLVAALTLGPAGEDQLVVFLDDNDETIRNQALLLLLLLELKAHGGAPNRCLACLSSRVARVRLTAARALECFAPSPQPAPPRGEGAKVAFLVFVVQQFNDRGDQQAWQIPAQDVDTLAELIVAGAPQTRARSASLLRCLSEKEQAAWDQAWEAHAGRFAPEIAALRERAAARPAVKPRYTHAQLQELAFGGYVGLVREQGGTQGQRTSVGPQVVRVRQTALRRVLEMATAGVPYARAAQPVLVQALGDPNQPVRQQALEALLTLGMSNTTLGAEALETGFTDLGIRGLQLLSGGAGTAEGQAVLEQVMLSRKDDLSIEAAKLLTEQRGAVPVAARALEAAHPALRRQAVSWLAAEYDKDAAARDHLGRALESRYAQVREAAALELAAKKDTRAFGSLVKLLQTQDQREQRRVIAALVQLGDPRTPDAFLDRVEKDPSKTALVSELFKAAGQFRRPENADRLLAMGEKKDWGEALRAVFVIGGFDQKVNDPEDESPDRTWEEKQFPRHTNILARILERTHALGATKVLLGFLPAARWARGPEVDPVLAALTTHPEPEVRQQAVESLGWRVRKRQAPADALVRAQQHRDPQTQFLAAEGLALAGRGEGLSVLLASIEYMTDEELGARAVRALGELGDLRALDTLLKLANEDGNPLQTDAAEALGHMGRSPQGPAIFALLERLARGNGPLAENAVKGLRWLNTHAAWQLIRSRAADEMFFYRSTAVELLAHNDDPATRDLLLRLLSTDSDTDVVSAALASARKLWGEASLDPDYALLQNPEAESVDDVADLLERVCERGEPRRLFEVLAHSPIEIQEPLATSLLNRPAPPLAEAEAAIGSNEPRTARVAGQILGRAGTKAASAGKGLEAALQRWQGIWDDRRRQMIQRNQRDDDLANKITPCLQSLVWAAGRLGVGRDVLLAASARGEDPLYRPVRMEAVGALASGAMAEPVLAALEAAALGNDPEIRTLAVDALSRRDARRAARLAEKVLQDRTSFNRLAGRDPAAVAGTLRTAAGQVHYQGVALPHLIVRGDVEGLSAVAADRRLPEATRLGAIEGLARLGGDAAAAKLVEIGKADKEEEELRKAAWRGLRRLQRERQRAHSK